MPVVAVIGAQWGDEGKGKFIDMLAEDAKVVVRFSGGDNAGHTIVNEFGKFALQLVPSGVFYPDVLCVIGNGVALNPGQLITEIDGLIERGIKIDTNNLIISDRANLVMPYHTLLDGLEEDSRGASAIGTTRKGIGPAFADKTARMGIRAGDLLDKTNFRTILSNRLDLKNAILTKLYGAEALKLDEVYDQYCRYAERLAPHIRETTLIIDEAISRNEPVLMEGAQGTLLDPDFGSYPFATSSSPMAGSVSLGAGIGPTKINKVLGLFKAYITRVGAGPMPTNLENSTGEKLRSLGNEYGTVSGRTRSCGWFDAVAARFSTRINGFTEAAITKLDILDSFPTIKICTSYKVDGEITDNFPGSISVLEKCQPVYEEMPGWQTPTSAIRKFEDLPSEARAYIDRLEEIVSCPVDFISVGSARDQIIMKKPVW